jgi:hypothetical protein
VRERLDAIGAFDARVTRSQSAYRRAHGFAWLWRPDRYLGGAHPPLVLSVALARHDSSPRWKEVVEAAPGRFTHHVELREAGEVDADVAAWLDEAWRLAE